MVQRFRRGFTTAEKTEMWDGETIITASIADEIAKLSELRHQGAITDEEFETLKSKLIT